MFLSIYASYRWAKSKHYLIKMAVFIVLASLLSTTFSYFFVLSFPFYSASSIGDAPPELFFYEVRLAIFGVIYPSESLSFSVSPYHFAILLFMLVNSLGAGLGYLINKKNIIPESHGWKSFLLLTAFGIAMFWIGSLLFHNPMWWWLDADSFEVFGVTWIAVVLGDFILFRQK